MIEAMAKALQSSPNPPVVHETFLDPYAQFFTLAGHGVYGANADWSDCYYANDLTGPSTGGGVVNSFNVDVTWVDPGKKLTTIYCYTPSSPDSTPMALLPCGQQASSSHGYAHDFYSDTVDGTLPSCASGYGFPLSKEGGGWANRGNYAPNGNNPLVLCGPSPRPQNPFPITIGQPFSLSLLPSATSSSGVIFLGTGAANLTTDDPAWLALGLAVTNPVNFVQFDGDFTDTNASEGLLSVYWNTNQIGMVDERVTLPGLQTYRFSLPGTTTNGLYALSFRLDSFTTDSSMTVTNVTTGFVGITQPIVLNMLLMGSNNTPVLKLTAAPGYNYLMQSSTNLADWVPTALLVNTNGTVLFADPAVTNSGARFYRALMP